MVDSSFLLILVATLMFGVVIGAALVAALLEFRRLRSENADLRAKLAELAEEKTKVRQTKRTFDGINDVLAVIARTDQAIDEAEVRIAQLMRYSRGNIQAAREKLAVIRSGPNAYDSEQPGKEPPRPDHWG